MCCVSVMGKYNVFKGEIPGDKEQHLYTLRGIGFQVSKFASEGYVIFHKRFQY